MSCPDVGDRIHIWGICLYHISNIYSVICMLTSAEVQYRFPSFFACCYNKSGNQKEGNKYRISFFPQLPRLVFGIEIH